MHGVSAGCAAPQAAHEGAVMYAHASTWLLQPRRQAIVCQTGALSSKGVEPGAVI